MGNTLIGEYQSTWDESAVKEWVKTATTQQQYSYHQFPGAKFHDITDFSIAMRITKICLAIYGPPSEDPEKLEEAYTGKQLEFARTVYEKIKEVHEKAPEPNFKLGFIFVNCKEGGSTYQVPLFRLMWRETDKSIESRYIDTSCRVYESSVDWEVNNRLLMLKYCYPTNLCYSESDKEVPIKYGSSPACDLSSRLARVGDAIVVAAVITISGMSIFAPAAMVAAAPLLIAIGFACGLFMAGRAAHRLVDKARHGERLADLESVLLFLTIIIAPLHLFSTMQMLSTARQVDRANLVRILTERMPNADQSFEKHKTMLSMLVAGQPFGPR